MTSILRSANTGERELVELVFKAQQNVLELMAGSAPLTEILSAINRVIALHAADMVCSILLVDTAPSADGAQRLYIGAADDLPKELRRELDGMPIGPNASPCGIAAHRREAVVVHDLRSDPSWGPHRELRLRHGLLGCWSTPIIAADGRLLGTFALYQRTPRSPVEHDRKLIGSMTRLVCLAIERERKDEALRRADAQARAISEAAPVAIMITRAADSVVVYANSLVGRIFDVPAEEVVGQRALDYYQDSAAREKLLQNLSVHGTVRGYELAMKRVGGDPLWLSCSAEPIEYLGEPSIVWGFIDITPRKRAEQALKASELRYRFLYDHNPTLFFTLDASGRILSVNDFGAQQLGYRANELIGTALEELAAEQHRAVLRRHLEACVSESGSVHRWEIRKRRKQGDEVWMRECARVVMDADGNVTVLVVCEDNTEDRRISERLSYEAAHDALTGLYNRRAFEQRLRQTLEQVRMEDSEHVLCYLDLDRFKIVNDTCGHQAGDRLLHRLGQALQQKVRKSDLLARLGGDEFGVLMAHCTLEQARGVAASLRDSVEALRFEWEGQSFSLSASFGLVAITAGDHDIGALLAAADKACYAAKRAGRNRVLAVTDQEPPA